MSRILITLGSFLIVAGIAAIVLKRLGSHLGGLPGDLTYRGRDFTLFAPLGTSILLSVLLSLALYAISRFRR